MRGVPEARYGIQPNRYAFGLAVFFIRVPAAQSKGEHKMTGRIALRSFTTLALVIAAAVPATSNAVDIRPVFRAGAEFGGDNIVKAATTGGSSSSRSIDANQGLSVGGGASILMDSKDIEGEVTLSYKFSSISAQNGDIDWSVLPLDALVFYRFPKFRLGGGLTYHLGPKLKGTGVASDLHATYKDALGLVLQADYRFAQKLALGLRYTSVNYKASSVQASSIIQASTPPTSANTNGIGIVFSMSF